MNSSYSDVSENRQHFVIPQLVFLQNDILVRKLHTNQKYYPDLSSGSSERVVKSTRLLAKIAAYLVIIGWLLCLAFLYRWHFINKISLDWLLTLTSQPSTSNFLTTPVHHLYEISMLVPQTSICVRKQVTCRKILAVFSDYIV